MVRLISHNLNSFPAGLNSLKDFMRCSRSPIDKLDVTYIDNYNGLTRDITVCSNEDLEICHSRKNSAQILEFDVFDSSNVAIRRGPIIGVLLNN